MKIYNTMTRTKEELVPLTPGEIKMYSCGVTVYDLSHIGHARMMIVFDVISRYLRFAGYRVTFVRNFTDIEDKIIRRANQEGVPASEVSERYIRAFRDDIAALGVLAPEVEPKATEHVPEMIGLIERLVAGGFAYVVDGDVYFEIRRFPRYGRLSGKNLDELLIGARVDVDERKRDLRDFALWKAAKPGEPWWPSPWGPGRPGWHIECSAMSVRYLGESFDIHGGGEDLIFPHHECEIAQTEAVTRKQFARYWLHNGMVNMGTEKMSKSVGNTLLIRDLVGRYNPEALRFYFLGSHYRGPIDFADAYVSDAGKALGRLRILVGRTFYLARTAGIPFDEPADHDLRADVVDRLVATLHDDDLRADVAAAYRHFRDGMDDDFNTPQALAALSELVTTLNRYHDAGVKEHRLVQFVAGVRVLFVLARALGLLYRHIDPFEFSDVQRARLDPLVAERENARRERNWARADQLRVEIDALGVAVEDTPTGPRYRWKDDQRA